MRAHGHKDMINREPWVQSELVQRVIKEAVFLRYDLIHYLYTQFYLASTEGTPIMRAMWYEFPEDPKAMNATKQFMWGESFLFVPKLKKPMFKMNRYFFPRNEDDREKWWSVDVYLPSHQKRDYDTIWYSYMTKTKVLPDDLSSGWLYN
jgi:alpha-glucosidase (family GH31 glycosyl hydrolase)